MSRQTTGCTHCVLDLMNQRTLSLTSGPPRNHRKLVSKYILYERRKLSHTRTAHTATPSHIYTRILSDCMFIKKNLKNSKNSDFAVDIGYLFGYLLQQIDKNSCIPTIVMVLFQRVSGTTVARNTGNTLRHAWEGRDGLGPSVPADIGSRTPGVDVRPHSTLAPVVLAVHHR